METPVGVGFALLAAVALAAQNLAVRRGTDSYRVADVLAVVFAVNLVVVVPVAALGLPDESFMPRAVVPLVAAGVVGSLAGRACYYEGIARLGASRAEPLKALFPLVAVGGAVVVLGEVVSLAAFGGVCLLVLGGPRSRWRRVPLP
jgi:drug/metabolite transporter (DMT)-like permease